MAKLFVLQNHPLSQDQLKDPAITGMELVATPELISKAWSQIPPGAGYNETMLEEIKTWLSQGGSGDKLVIAGELGHSMRVAQIASELCIVAITATTIRESVEKAAPDGSVVKTNVFRHAGFRPLPV